MDGGHFYGQQPSPNGYNNYSGYQPSFGQQQGGQQHQQQGLPAPMIRSNSNSRVNRSPTLPPIQEATYHAKPVTSTLNTMSSSRMGSRAPSNATLRPQPPTSSNRGGYATRPRNNNNNSNNDTSSSMHSSPSSSQTSAFPFHASPLTQQHFAMMQQQQRIQSMVPLQPQFLANPNYLIAPIQPQYGYNNGSMLTSPTSPQFTQQGSPAPAPFWLQNLQQHNPHAGYALQPFSPNFPPSVVMDPYSQYNPNNNISPSASPIVQAQRPMLQRNPSNRTISSAQLDASQGPQPGRLSRQNSSSSLRSPAREVVSAGFMPPVGERRNSLGTHERYSVARTDNHLPKPDVFPNPIGILYQGNSNDFSSSRASLNSNGEYKPYSLKDWRRIREKDKSMKLPAAIPGTADPGWEEKHGKWLRQKQFGLKVRVEMLNRPQSYQQQGGSLDERPAWRRA